MAEEVGAEQEAEHAVAYALDSPQGYDQLVDALAAAIKYNDARKRGNPSIATEHAAMDLDDALSALRGNHDG